MSCRDYLVLSLCSLAFDQVNQQLLTRRVDTIVDLLEHIEASRVRAEKSRQHGEKAQRTVRRRIG